ncbi:nucleoside triphosphate pyrophosphohydrolase [Bacillus sp. FJAT-27986]|uniref:nucleoside triphosphate pyrophosphohydrolase n=1 Tax=Bacillus sp. FJAT-27986 TaxID=1743146 RepID=UPI00080AC3F4|nr:nucleoside triphosphate pyrophosphohydrolase [Bacillus sp. FJAT-27986]OCA86164.1 phosphoribosyl-ATP pyrophosphohydrolase [Bacillus sp. FJAT-27986]
MPIHNKLVRDLIPNIIEETGKKFSTRILDNDEYVKELRKKSQEELQEYLETKDDESAIEELADLLEIIYALSKCHGADIDKVEEVRVKKAAKRGGFEEKIFLIEVED